LNIYEKLLEVRKAVPFLKKEAQGHQYKYVSSSQVLQSLREAMDEQKLLLIVKVTDSKVTPETVEYMDGNKQKKTTTYFTELFVEFTWVNAEKPDEVIVCPWYGQGVDTAGERGVGKALTYAEKYFLLKSFNVATDKDDPDANQGKSDYKQKDQSATYEAAQKTFDDPDYEMDPNDKDLPGLQPTGTKADQVRSGCEICDAEMTQAAMTVSKKNFDGRVLCAKCQKEGK
jgi:hypothetical protein